jgi:ribonucleoside-triphosphate reductase
MTSIIKRDGRVERFNRQKIMNAIKKAFLAVDGTLTKAGVNKARRIAKEIEEMVIQSEENFTVEKIQDIVEEKLMETNRKDVAKAYIIYREQRSVTRTRNSQLMKDVGVKIMASDVQNQNANVDELSFGGRMGEARGEIMKRYALDYIISDMARENHLNNEVYIHDLDSYAVGMHNCLTIPFDDLLANGFNTRQTDVRPANSVNTAFQLVAVIFQLQSLQQFGGVSAGHIDWTMVPYVRKSFFKHWRDGHKYILRNAEADTLYFNPDMSIEDDYYKDDAYTYAIEMTQRELTQAVEGMYHNLNTLQSRSGNQLPFTSINYGTCTLPEGRMVTKALLEGSIKGVGKVKKTAIFPCGIFQCMEGVNRKEGDPNYDLYKLALKSTSQRLYPNYANVDWSNNAGYDKNDPRTYFGTMGCRTANLWDVNGLGQLKDGRGNICPVTIIMPTLAMQAKEEYEYRKEKGILNSQDTAISIFKQLLDKKIAEARDMLIERFEFICSQSSDSAKFMYENGLMAGYVPEEGIRSALKHGTLALGQLGLAETLQILIGCDHTERAGMILAKEIEQMFKDRCKEYKEEYKLNFGVYYTPAENLCFTAMKKFKAKYGSIPNVSDKEFFTNSIHVPVWKKVSPFEKIDIEGELTGYSSAGCITYVELDSGAKNNLQALETLVNYAMDKDIPYFAINVPNDTCLSCGYCDEFNNTCPECGSDNIQQLRRVTGYLTGNYKTAFNKGKQQETEMRYKHSRQLKEWQR